MSLPNNTIYIPSYDLPLICHEIDHQYLYQTKEPDKIFAQLIQEQMLYTKYIETGDSKFNPYEYIASNINEITTLEGQAQFIEDYVRNGLETV